MNEHDEFVNWLNVGLDKGWVAFPKCSTHDLVPITPDEEAEMDLGFDPCIVVMRLWYGQ